MRLKKLSPDFEKYKDYEKQQKTVVSTMISRLNRIGDFFDVIVKLEKFMIEEVRDEYAALVDIREKKNEIVEKEGIEKYIQDYFIPTVEALNSKMSRSIESWNHVEREHTTGKIYGFISAMKNFYKELEKLDKNESDEEDDSIHGSSMAFIIKEILDGFGNFKMYKAATSDDTVEKVEILLSMQGDILDYKQNPTSEVSSLTLDDL